ncbi:hypothetical protein LSH36_184g02005 [Paralvinella palmiformis]|uniref:Galaxin-like repeats domain-containing protein n=1 Tax=Paralvinella palmiformis TaxID=53620 RepID=A0AAD9N899_9ANNE|nr:hypothetical protein LSH36_184g02005 [Paralvinella palmiformis]
MHELYLIVINVMLHYIPSNHSLTEAVVEESMGVNVDEVAVNKDDDNKVQRMLYFTKNKRIRQRITVMFKAMPLEYPLPRKIGLNNYFILDWKAPKPLALAKRHLPTFDGYVFTGWICCDGVMHVTTGNTSIVRCCGSRTYNSTIQLCCAGSDPADASVHNVSDPSLYGCCGLNVYAKSTQYCDELTTTVMYNIRRHRKSRSLTCTEGGCCDGKYVAFGKEDLTPNSDVFGCGCCGKVAYNVLTEECCSPEMESIARKGEICCNGKAVSARGGMVCCGGEAINLHNKRCCHKYGRKGRLLKESPYSLATEQCCGGEVVNGSVPCCNQKWPMNPKRQVCCPYHGPQNKTNHLQDACCEDQWTSFVQPYNSKTEVCIQNEVAKRDTMCEDGMALCGTTCYHPDTAICCSDVRVYSKLTDGDKCCGGEAYFTWSQSCCNGHLYNTSLLKCCCNGKIPYDPFTEKCLERKKRPTSCKVVGCPAHISSKGQLLKIKEHLLTNKWLVAKARSVVKPKLGDDFIQFLAVIVSSKEKKNIRIKVLRGCSPTIGKHKVVFLLRSEKVRRHKTLLIATQGDYILKRKGFYQRAKKCINLLLKGRPPRKNNECKTLFKRKIDIF